MALPQGDLGLLQSDVAQRLLSSTHFARLAFIAKDGTPRVIPMLFHWVGVVDFQHRFSERMPDVAKG